MNLLTISCAIVIVILFCMPTTHQQQDPHNVTQWAKSREKRFLIFQTQGVHKFIISFVLSIDLKDKRAWRALSGAWNYQWQHNLPLTALYWWNSTYFPGGPSSSRLLGEVNVPLQQHPEDPTAIFLYALIESYMNNKGMNGRECLQRAICENAQVHYVGGVMDRIYQRLMTPERGMEEYYKDSYAIGLKGVDCYKTYFECPKGESIFDPFVHIVDL